MTWCAAAAFRSCFASEWEAARRRARPARAQAVTGTSAHEATSSAPFLSSSSIVYAAAMGRVGPAELLILGAVLLSVVAVVFFLGFFVGKGVGFKQGLREAERMRHGGRPS